MKSLKIITALNIVFSFFSICLFIFNQLCNLRFWGLWTAWNLSGFAYGLLVGPLAAAFACIGFGLSLSKLCNPAKQKKYIIINTVCAALTVGLLLCGYIFDGVYLWA